MPDNHATHEAPSKSAPSIIERWSCRVATCRNHGQLCYWAVSNIADEHLPITSVGMQYWLAAISRKESTIDVPPPQLVEEWQLRNLRVLQRREERREGKQERREQREEQREQRAARKASARKSSARKSSAQNSSNQSSVRSKIVGWT